MTTSLVVAACGDNQGPQDAPQCGPSGASANGLVASATGVTLTYGAMVGGLNNDCPDPDGAPEGIVSLTVHGTQTDGTGQFTLCIARPDIITTMSQALGPDLATSPVRLVDMDGTSNSCNLALGTTVTGTVSTTGLCGNGEDPSGFAMVINATVAMTSSCQADPVDVQLAGTVAVAMQ